MTTTDQFSAPPPPSPTPPAPTPPHSRVLRRSRTDRVGAGVAGGLGEYFDVDPVLFRVLFATASFFGGAGVLAYLVAWAAIPEQGAANAPIDRFISGLRRRRVPVWLVAGVAGLLLWALAFSWWAPTHFFPVIVVVIVVAAIFGRRSNSGHRPDREGAEPPVPGAAPPVSLDKDGVPAAGSPTWVNETRQWITEARAASRLRRRRAMPVRLATLGALGVTLTIFALVDAARGIALPVYFWTTLGIVALGLLAGMVLRRTPWTVAALLLPAILGLVAFGGSPARLHDGFGQREWTPTSPAGIASNYRLAFGQATLDLRHIGTMDRSRTLHVTLAAGEAVIFLPPTMNATVNLNLRFGDLRLDGTDLVDHGGVNLNRTILPPAGAIGPAVTIDVHVADGRIVVERG